MIAQRVYAFLALLLVLALAGCGAPTASDTAGQTLEGNAANTLSIGGSSALFPLLQAAASQFMQRTPGVTVTTTSSSSGAGRSQVCASTIAIGASDVALSAEEKTKYNCADAVETAVAIQAFVPVAHPSGPGALTSLSRDQLAGIFSGQITNWRDVGGDDRSIVVINRRLGSGTRANMAKFLFNGEDKFIDGAAEEESSGVQEAVQQTPGAISYVSLAFLTPKTMHVIGIDGVAPSRETIQAGTWPIGGPGYLITKGQPTQLAQSFIQFVTSPEFENSPTFSGLGFVAPK